MKKHLINLSITCLITAAYISNSYAQNIKPIYLNTAYSFRERAADLVSRMTLGEEVLQLHTNFAPASMALIPCLEIYTMVTPKRKVFFLPLMPPVFRLISQQP
jgi:hypothetical protein